MPGTTTRTFDVIVIGAGPVGENVADRTTAAGLDTVVVEAELVGGECSYWACDPSKALLLTARHAVAVCTGTSAALPPLPDLDDLRPPWG